MEYATLHTGAKMPLLGYGTWQARPGELDAPLDAALEAGYRHIDTASAYENEDTIGKILHEKWLGPGKLKREDLFICTKLPPIAIRPGGADKWLKRSLEKMRLDYVDLYLMHMPMCIKEEVGNPDNLHPFGPDGKIGFEDDTDHVTIWKEMEAQVAAGRAKAIGVSNFNKRQLQGILNICTIKPANLQVELHVYMQHKPLVDFCHKNDITVTAYSPLGSRGTPEAFKHLGFDMKVPDLFSDPVIVELAKKHQKLPGQILLKHIVQRGIVAIPKSLSKERLAQNIDLFSFKLSAVDMARIDTIDKGKDGRIFNFIFLGMSPTHPKYPHGEYP